MKRIAIITARGGSKRIPGKNIKDFLGKPIIAYSIEAALNSGLFDEVMVSTDSNEIAEVGKEYGAKVPFLRSDQNANDFASTVDVIVEVIEKYGQEGVKFDIGCCIYPTAPFISDALLNESLKMLMEQNFETVFPIMKFSFPIQRALRKTDAQKIAPFHPEHVNTRSQDLEQAFHDAGQFYWFRPEKLLSSRKLWTDNSGGILISEMDAHDIDYPEDWEIAEFKYKLKYGEETQGDF